MTTSYDSAKAAAETLLRYMGEDPDRDGLNGTPGRFVRALTELTCGLHQTPNAHLSVTFESEEYDQMVVVRRIPFVSLCEHHLLPFTGTATIGYLPGDGRVVGLSKIPRALHALARKPQIQERLTREMADALDRNLRPEGCGVLLRATHSCMTIRGAQTDGEMVTSALLGKFREDPTVRAEFLALARGDA